VLHLTATKVDVAPSLPAYCDVRGTMWPEIGFAVKLPIPWNGKFYMVGNGGKAGNIEEGAMANGLKLGYVTASTNTGHDNKREKGAMFGYNPPDNSNPNARQKEIDFGYRSVHETAVIAKKIMQAYYGSLPAHSYWVGCSTGGRQGLIEAQQYPDDFDGIVAGAPVYNYMAVQIYAPWYLQAFLAPETKLHDKLPILGSAIYAKCDGIDGLVDGLIDDPLRCGFDPAKDLPRCRGNVDRPSCFTDAQARALQKVYEGPVSNGKPLFPGLPPGGEAMAGGWGQWIVGTPTSQPQQFSLMFDAFKYLCFEVDDPNYDFRTDFNFETDPPKLDVMGKILNATNPDLSAFNARKGKLLMYHGWADDGPNPVQTVQYYTNIRKTFGNRVTKSFVRLYMVPGMGHCSGGIGCDKVDWVTPLVNWVENGTEPGALIGAASSGTPRTRPICPYPEVARYEGKGSVDDAGNFTCVKTIPAHVRIEPDTLKLKSRGTFTASMTLPDTMRDWKLRSVVCEGALAVKVSKKQYTYKARFNKQDLKDIMTGNAVKFRVYAIVERDARRLRHGDNDTQWLFERHGYRVAFEGSGTVRVVE
jgi:feruloyl esterase